MDRIEESVLVMLAAHDGDDRCGCLRALIGWVYTHQNAPEVGVKVAETVTNCIASHPSGVAWRRVNKSKGN